MITNMRLINARACPGGFYLQTKILEFIESVLLIIVKKREKNATNSIKKIDAWL